MKGDKRKMKHTPEEIKYRLSDLGVQIGNIAIEYIGELEKENAELKKKKEEIEIMTEFCKTCKQMHTDQLTKAKKIIKKLYSHVFQGMDFMELIDYNIQKAEAEQFLSEVEK
jgi:chaperonin cofactor prefoldin